MRVSVIRPAVAVRRQRNRDRRVIAHRERAVSCRYRVVARRAGGECVAGQFVRHGALAHIRDAARYNRADRVAAHKAFYCVVRVGMRSAVILERFARRRHCHSLRRDCQSTVGRRDRISSGDVLRAVHDGIAGDFIVNVALGHVGDCAFDNRRQNVAVFEGVSAVRADRDGRAAFNAQLVAVQSMRVSVIRPAVAVRRQRNRDRRVIAHRERAVSCRYRVVARRAGGDFVAGQFVRHGALAHIRDAARYNRADRVFAHKASDRVVRVGMRSAVVLERFARRRHCHSLRRDCQRAVDDCTERIIVCCARAVAIKHLITGNLITSTADISDRSFNSRIQLIAGAQVIVTVAIPGAAHLRSRKGSGITVIRQSGSVVNLGVAVSRQINQFRDRIDINPAVRHNEDDITEVCIDVCKLAPMFLVGIRRADKTHVGLTHNGSDSFGASAEREVIFRIQRVIDVHVVAGHFMFRAVVRLSVRMARDRNNHRVKRQNLHPAVRHNEGHIGEVGILILEVADRQTHVRRADFRAFRRRVAAECEVSYRVQRVIDLHVVAGYFMFLTVVRLSVRMARDRYDHRGKRIDRQQAFGVRYCIIGRNRRIVVLYSRFIDLVSLGSGVGDGAVRRHGSGEHRLGIAVDKAVSLEIRLRECFTVICLFSTFRRDCQRNLIIDGDDVEGGIDLNGHRVFSRRIAADSRLLIIVIQVFGRIGRRGQGFADRLYARLICADGNRGAVQIVMDGVSGLVELEVELQGQRIIRFDRTAFHIRGSRIIDILAVLLVRLIGLGHRNGGIRGSGADKCFARSRGIAQGAIRVQNLIEEFDRVLRVTVSRVSDGHRLIFGGHIPADNRDIRGIAKDRGRGDFVRLVIQQRLSIGRSSCSAIRVNVIDGQLIRIQRIGHGEFILVVLYDIRRIANGNIGLRQG